MRTWLYVGCYTNESATGIHCFDASHGDLEHRWQVDDIEHASFLAVSADHATVYAVSETTDDGSLVAYHRSPDDGSLRRLDEVPSQGAAPCHLSIDGDRVHVANYGSGTVASYLLHEDGTFARLVATGRHHGAGPHPRQAEPHAHCVIAAPGSTSVYAADLGTDRIVRYVNPPAGGTVEWSVADETPLPPGAGPRHVTFHPDHPIAYVLCELDNRLVVCDVEETGRLRLRSSVSTLPVGFAGPSIAAEVAVHPEGHRVYVSNRGHDSIATFAIDDPDDAPTLIEHVPSGGRTPRHFAIHPSGASLLVANQDSDTLVSFALDGDAIPRRPRPVAEVSQPVCVVFVEDDR